MTHPRSRNPALTPWTRSHFMIGCWPIANFAIGLGHLAEWLTPFRLPRYVGLAILGALACTHLGVWFRHRPIRQRWCAEARPQWWVRGHLNGQVHYLVREGLDAARSEDPQMLNEAVAEIRAAPPEVIREALDLLIAINALALYALAENAWPSDAERADLARRFFSDSAGFGVSSFRAKFFMTRLELTDPSTRIFPSADTLVIGFAVGAWLVEHATEHESIGASRFLREIERTLETGAGRVPAVWLV